MPLDFSLCIVKRDLKSRQKNPFQVQPTELKILQHPRHDDLENSTSARAIAYHEATAYQLLYIHMPQVRYSTRSVTR